MWMTAGDQLPFTCLLYYVHVYGYVCGMHSDDTVMIFTLLWLVAKQP